MNACNEIVWIDEANSSRCDVPKLVLPFAKIPGWIGLAAAIFMSVIPCAIIGVFCLLLPDEAPLMPILLTFGGFFAVVIFPVIAFITRKSLLVLLGSKRIVIDDKWVRVITQAGPLWSTTKCRLSSLGGFQVEDPKGERYQFNVDYSNLVAVKKDGREIHLLRMYANEIVGQLIEQLPNKIEQVTGKYGVVQPDRIRATDLATELSAVDPSRIQKRSEKPIGSDLAIATENQERVITIPPLGWRKSTSGFIRYWCFGFILTEVVLLVGLVPALLAGKVNGQPAAGWLIVCVFTTIAIIIMLTRKNAAMRRGAVRVGKTSLSLTEIDILGQHHAEWPRKSIESVGVGVAEHGQSASVSHDYFVQVELGTGKSPNQHMREWFNNREKGEIEWIVTTIVEQLDLNSNMR